MSNQVYGYAVLRSATAEATFGEAAVAAAEKTGLGFSKIGDDELFNFPCEHLPHGPHVSFRISDGPGKNTASYLVDFETYAPGSDIGLPLDGRERLQMLIHLLVEIAALDTVEQLDVSITDCDEIEEVVVIETSSFPSRLVADMEEFAPPNKLYVLRASS